MALYDTWLSTGLNILWQWQQQPVATQSVDNSRFPWMNEAQIQWIAEEAYKASWSMKWYDFEAAKDEIYRKAMEYKKQKSDLEQRSWVKNSLYKQSLEAKWPIEAKAALATLRIADMADLIRDRVPSMKGYKDDWELLAKVFGDIPNGKQRLADYLNWDISVYEKLKWWADRDTKLMRKVAEIPDDKLTQLMSEYQVAKERRWQKVPKWDTLLWKLWNWIKGDYVEEWVDEGIGFAKFVRDSQKTFADVALQDFGLYPDVYAGAVAWAADVVWNAASFLVWAINPETWEAIKDATEIQSVLKNVGLADTRMFDVSKMATEMWLGILWAEKLLSWVSNIWALEKLAAKFPNWSKYLVKPVGKAVLWGETYSVLESWKAASPRDIWTFIAADVWLPALWSVASSVKRALSPNARDLINKALKPRLSWRKSTVKWLAQFENNVLDAAESVVKNKQNLKFLDEKTGEIVEGVLPRSVRDFAESIGDTKLTVYNAYRAMEWEWADILIPTNAIIEWLEGAKKMRWVDIASPWIQNHLDRQITNIKNLWDLNVDDAARIIKQLWSRVRAFMDNPTPNDISQVVVDNWIASQLRKWLNEAVDWMLGTPQYSELKRAFSALTAIEKDVNRRATSLAWKNAKALTDFLDALNAWDLAYGIVNANPGAVAKWVIQQWMKTLYKHINEPNKNIARLFEMIEKKMTKKWIVQPFGKAAPKVTEALPDLWEWLWAIKELPFQ